MMNILFLCYLATRNNFHINIVILLCFISICNYLTEINIFNLNIFVVL